MTQERAKELLPVITAFANGDTIQVRLIGWHWEDYPLHGEPDFSNTAWDWRIKPLPRKAWVNEYKGGNLFAHLSREKADREAGDGSSRIACHEIELPTLP